MTETPLPASTSPATRADDAQRIASGYQFTGEALEMGSVLLDGQPYPQARIRVPLAMVNRHGLIAGATGTGKTKTLQVLTEQLSAAGVPVVIADIKGDLSGLAQAGTTNDKITQRAVDTADDWAPTAYPVEFLALGGVGTGVPLRATMTSFGPTLLAKVLGCNSTQESSLGLIFHYADTAGLPLLDLKDLRAVIQFLTSDDGKADLKNLGGLSSATAGVILRQLITLETQGGDVFFGEPEFDTADLLRTDAQGRGVISSIELANLQDRPTLFSTFLMWLLADLFHELPEVGDLAKPKLVFFFDEAHLLFNGASKAFLEAVTQTVRSGPVERGRHLLRDAESHRRARFRARPAGQSGAACAACVHARRRGRAGQGSQDVSEDEGLRPVRSPHPAGNRRGGGDRAGRVRRAHPGRLDPPARAAVADGPDRPGRPAAGRRGVAPAGAVRAIARSRVRV